MFAQCLTDLADGIDSTDRAAALEVVAETLILIRRTLVKGK